MGIRKRNYSSQALYLFYMLKFFSFFFSIISKDILSIIDSNSVPCTEKGLNWCLMHKYGNLMLMQNWENNFLNIILNKIIYSLNWQSYTVRLVHLLHKWIKGYTKFLTFFMTNTHLSILKIFHCWEHTMYVYDSICMHQTWPEYFEKSIDNVLVIKW